MIKIKTRICKGCQKEFPETEEFFSKASNQSGKIYWRIYCRDCNKLVCVGKKHLIKKYNSKEKNIKICSRCEKELIFSSFYKKDNLCKKCRKISNKKAYEKRKIKINNGAPKINNKTQKINNKAPKNENINNDEIIIERAQNGLSGDLKAIRMYEDLSGDLYKLMRINRIKKYLPATQELILGLMKNCFVYLQKELNLIKIKKIEKKEIEEFKKIDKKMIDIDW